MINHNILDHGYHTVPRYGMTDTHHTTTVAVEYMSPKQRFGRIYDTLYPPPSNAKLPPLSEADTANKAAMELTEDLKNNSPSEPLLKPTTETM